MVAETLLVESWVLSGEGEANMEGREEGPLCGEERRHTCTTHTTNRE